MSNSKRNAKPRARKAPQAREVRFARHLWSTMPDDDQDDDDGNGQGSSPVVGYSYQSFGGCFFYSLLRPSDMTHILRQLESGKKLSTKMILHFSDEYCDVATAILANDDIVMTDKTDDLHLATAACMHLLMQNKSLAFAICLHLVGSGMSWADFSHRCRLFSDESMNSDLLQEISNTWEAANALNVLGRLDSELSTKPTTQKTIKI